MTTAVSVGQIDATIGRPEPSATVIVPAYDEAAVIGRLLDSMAPGAVRGDWQLLIACNGCTDDTADLARTYPGVEVIELPRGSKPAALNAADEVAIGDVRIYLDADIQITAEAASKLIAHLAAEPGAMAGRPPFRYDIAGASALVGAFYRARSRIPSTEKHLWGAGIYALNAMARRRFDRFPMITADDLYVDSRFAAHEKVVIDTEPVVVQVPRTAQSLLAVLRRTYRGNAELAAQPGAATVTPESSVATLTALIRGTRGPRSMVDAAVYVSFVLLARMGGRRRARWERDQTARATSPALSEDPYSKDYQ